MSDYDTIWQRTLNKALDAGKSWDDAVKEAYSVQSIGKIENPPVDVESPNDIEIKRLRWWLGYIERSYPEMGVIVRTVLNGAGIPQA